MEKNNTNRNYKNSVFTLLFGEKEKLLELYNAVSGQNYPESTELEIITLSDALFMEQLNDIAFVLDGKLVVLIEHQSTINENMPLRMLMYMAREYQKITDKRDLYKKQLVKVPTPEFIALYNGKEEYPDFKELRLSDAFKCKRESSLELVVKVWNISKGRNAGMASRSPSLNGYSELVAEVEENKKSMGLEAAVKIAIKACMSRDILVYFLEKHASEVENMLLTEWNLKDALEVEREEGIGIGEARGIGIGETRGITKTLDLLKQGKTIAEVERLLTASPQPAAT